MGIYNFGLGMTPAQEEEYKRKLWASLDEEARSKIFSPGDEYKIKPGAGGGPNEVWNALLGEEKSRLLGKKQKLFDIAAKGGAQHGGTAIAGAGGATGVSYADPYPGDPTERFPKSITEEEEKYRLDLRAPGFATFGQYKW